MMTEKRHSGFITSLALSVALGCVLTAGCSKKPETAKEEAAETKQAPPPAPPAETAKQAEAPTKEGEAPQLFKVRFTTSKGPFVIEVHKEWAPIGAQRFYELVKAGFYNDCRFFRVVPNFVVQFGLAANPAMNKRWKTPIADDPVGQTNKLGSVTFATAGPNTRTTQLFINLRSNQFLDNQGFAPFGVVTEGMDVVQHIFSGYGEQPDQDEITNLGNSYLKEKFPKLDYIRKAAIL